VSSRGCLDDGLHPVNYNPRATRQRLVKARVRASDALTWRFFDRTINVACARKERPTYVPSVLRQLRNRKGKIKKQRIKRIIEKRISLATMNDRDNARRQHVSIPQFATILIKVS